MSDLPIQDVKPPSFTESPEYGRMVKQWSLRLQTIVDKLLAIKTDQSPEKIGEQARGLILEYNATKQAFDDVKTYFTPPANHS